MFYGWVVVLGSIILRGVWSLSDVFYYISYFEMLVVYFVLKVFCVYYEGIYVRVMIDCFIVFIIFEYMSWYKLFVIFVMKILVIYFVRYDEE